MITTNKALLNKGINIDRYSCFVIFIFLTIRLILIIVTEFSGSTPFLVYDDYMIYNRITRLDNFDLENTLIFRNCYYWICLYLNKIRLGSYFTGTRILNVLLWYHACIKIKNIASLFKYDEKVTRSCFVFMAASPIFVFYSMVPLRECLCAWLVINLICTFLSYENGLNINYISVICELIILYFIRTGILEALIIVILLYKFKTFKPYLKIILIIFTFAILYNLFHSFNYMYVINDKLQSYIFNDKVSTGFFARLSINKISDVYKLIILIPLVQIIPLPGAFEKTLFSWNSWGAWITLFAAIPAFFLPYFWSYVYNMRKSNLEKVVLLFYFIMVVILAVSNPSNSRFFFFTTPIYYLFGIRGFYLKKDKNRKNVIYGILFSIIPYLYLLK